MDRQERLIWVDRMRGLAILSVVIQHLTYYYLNDIIYHKLIGISNMAVFFFISGYILEKTTEIKNIKEYISFA
jgi:fucose 4-O-acetylase-like acetyltransferase